MSVPEPTAVAGGAGDTVINADRTTSQVLFISPLGTADAAGRARRFGEWFGQRGPETGRAITSARLLLPQEARAVPALAAQPGIEGLSVYCVVCTEVFLAWAWERFVRQTPVLAQDTAFLDLVARFLSAPENQDLPAPGQPAPLPAPSTPATPPASPYYRVAPSAALAGNTSGKPVREDPDFKRLANTVSDLKDTLDGVVNASRAAEKRWQRIDELLQVKPGQAGRPEEPPISFNLPGQAPSEKVEFLDEDGTPIPEGTVNPFATPLDDGRMRMAQLLALVKEPRFSFEDVIVEDSCREAVENVLGQLKYLSKLEAWGITEKLAKGIGMSMLFWGVPGTGKTMMAEAIAKALGTRVWIVGSGEFNGMFVGDFEKTCTFLFDRADERGYVLVLDEVDSLVMARDGELADGVRYSRDPLTVGMVNHLLRKLEEFKGVCILTTNRLRTLDEAVERRLTLIQEFAFPTPELRERIWRSLIPARCPVAEDVDFAKLAEFVFAGGHIKNAVLNAARKAAGENADQVTMAHFLFGVEKVLKGRKAFTTGGAGEGESDEGARPKGDPELMDKMDPRNHFRRIFNASMRNPGLN